MNVSVVIATYGAERWRDLAYARAFPSAQSQTEDIQVFHDPEGTIASVRNEAAATAKGDWLCFLDADDELAPGFIGAMERASEQEQGADGSPLLLTPAVSYTGERQRRRSSPRIWPECALERGNWLVISTLIPRDLFLEIGGFRDYGDPPGSIGYEDWGLFARLVQTGARIVKVPEAVLIAHITPQSRNRSATPRERNFWHYEVGRDVWPEIYDSNWLTANQPRMREPRRRRRVA
jgi:glycosyltransferase involved in cell wall biosynthesis